jgi:chitin synthase
LYSIPTGAASMAFAGSNPFISTYNQNGFDEFCINFTDELLHFYVVRNMFEDTVGRDGVSLPAIVTMDNSACVELLRGSQLNERVHRKLNRVIEMMSKVSLSFKPGKTSDNRDEELLQDLVTKLGVHSSFVASLSVSDLQTGIFLGSTTTLETVPTMSQALLRRMLGC